MVVEDILAQQRTDSFECRRRRADSRQVPRTTTTLKEPSLRQTMKSSGECQLQIIGGRAGLHAAGIPQAAGPHARRGRTCVVQAQPGGTLRQHAGLQVWV
jgi:hypothetical protein